MVGLFRTAPLGVKEGIMDWIYLLIMCVATIVNGASESRLGGSLSIGVLAFAAMSIDVHNLF